MPLNMEDKKAVVAEVSAEVAQAQTMVLAEYRGIPVGELTTLRAQARANGVYLRVRRTLWHVVRFKERRSNHWPVKWLVRLFTVSPQTQLRQQKF